MFSNSIIMCTYNITTIEFRNLYFCNNYFKKYIYNVTILIAYPFLFLNLKYMWKLN